MRPLVPRPLTAGAFAPYGEVTGELAQSDNSVFVIVGDTENGLPMIYQPPAR